MESFEFVDLIRLIAVVFLVLANAFFVAAEFALISVRRTRVEELLAQGNINAKWVKRALEDPDRFIAATQLGITLASLGLGWIGEPALGKLLQPLIDLFPAALEDELSLGFSAGLAFALITFLHVVVGELMPKSIALQDPERTALIVAQPTLWTVRLMSPAIWLLNGVGNRLLKVLGFEPASAHEMVHSAEELKMLATASAESGLMNDTEEEMLHAVFDFGDMLVRQIMVPRTELIAVKAGSTLEEIIEISIQHPFTKYPVYEDNLDHVIGVVHLKDMVNALHGKDKSPKIAQDLMREAIFIPETARLDSLLSRFRARKRHIAIVIDEYGGTAGVVTLEDLLEEIVGEVSDPFDDEPEILALPGGSSSIDGLTLIDEVNEHFDLQLRDSDYDTIAGYVLGRLGRMAQVGDIILADGAELLITTMDGLRIARLTLTLSNVPEEEPPAVELPAE